MTSSDIRVIVGHYHLFKNAGSSVDEILLNSFGDNWVSKEFSKPGVRADNSKILSWLEENSHLQAFSCHNAVFPPPVSTGLLIVPIIFVRHPILRIQSAYDFERKQGNMTYGARLASQSTFRDYVLSRLEKPTDSAIQNFQSSRVADMMPTGFGNLYSRTMAALALLPFVGIVDFFFESMKELRGVLDKKGVKLVLSNAQVNVGPNSLFPAADRLTSIKAELGLKLYERLCFENSCDFFLYRTVRGRFDDNR